MSSVVIYLSNPPSSTAAATANVVVWVTAPTTTTGGGGSNISNNNNSNSHELSYYHYQDHSHLFSHTNALIQRLAPTTLVHVATSRISSSKQIPKGTPKQQQQQQKPPDPTVRRLLRVLEESLASISNTMVLSGEQPEESPDAPAPISSAVQFHDSYGSSNNNNNYSNSKMDPARLTSVVQQLWWTRNEPIGNVSSDNASTAPPTAPPTTTKTTANDPHSRGWLQWTGQVAWQQHPEIADALVFLLHTVNQWPCPKSNSNSNSWCIASITQGHLHSVLSLDSTAADAIHLWPPAIAAQQCVTGGRTATNSIYGVLSGACRTPLGQRRIHQWLRHPLVQIDAIVARQDAVAHFVAESMARDALRTVGLRPFATTDLSKLAATLAHYASSVVDDNNHAETTDATTHPNETTTTTAETSLRTPPTNARRALMALYDLYLVSSQKIPLLTEQLEMTVFVASTSSSEEDQEEDSPPQQSSGILSDILSTLQQCRTELERSVALIEAVLDLNQAPREFLVQADYKEELRDILEELDQGSADLEDCHARMNDLWAEVSGTASNNNNPTVRLESSSDDGCSAWQFRLPNTNDSKILQHQLADRVTVHKVLKNGVYFSTKELRHLSEKQQDLRAEYDRHQLAIVLDAASVAATYGPVLERASDAVSHLDALAALAHTAAYSPHGYCRPIMTDSDEDGCGIDLKAARHPCVELQDSVDFIPNDYKLIFGESSFLMVTGPNMGGKSTYIRALGAIVTMAQIGSFVPCTSATINICHHILARVGAGDLQERGISTFMAEMLESSAILRTATKRSLIIIDELGRGTSTFDGYGLARAISEYVVQNIGCMTVFATHFHELTVLEDQEKAVKNCHVTAQKGIQGLTFLYEIKPGPCLESFGIQVAEMANVPAVVIQDAKRRARELENFEYRKKARSIVDDDTSADIEHSMSEEASAIVAFVDRFRSIPKDWFSSQFATEDDKKTAILQLLAA